MAMMNIVIDKISNIVEIKYNTLISNIHENMSNCFISFHSNCTNNPLTKKYFFATLFDWVKLLFIDIPTKLLL